jgi:VWFA-related protein
MRNSAVFCLALCRTVSMLALPTLCVDLAAQQPNGQQPSGDQPAATLKIQAREVVLPVTVWDKHGKLVTSLNISDFTLTEDGRPQTIKSFTRESSLPFRLGLLVDTSRSVSGAIDSESKAAGKFVDQMLPAGPKADPKSDPKPNADPKAAGDAKVDQAFLIHFDNEVELLEDFTNSREKLHRELDGMGPTRAAQMSQAPPDSGGGDEPGNGRGGRPMPGARGGTQLYDAIYLASDELMRPKDGRKALVVFSDGVDRGSKETLNDAVDAADRASVTVYTIYFKGEQEKGGNTFPGSGRQGPMGGGWPGGSGGGGWPGGGGGGRPGGGEDHKLEVDGKKIMEKIAVRTGGRYFEAKKKENLDEIYGQIVEELRGQYLLTYTPDVVDKEGGYHKIALKANKGDLSVHTREGYYAPTEGAK